MRQAGLVIMILASGWLLGGCNNSQATLDAKYWEVLLAVRQVMSTESADFSSKEIEPGKMQFSAGHKPLPGLMPDKPQSGTTITVTRVTQEKTKVKIRSYCDEMVAAVRDFEHEKRLMELIRGTLRYDQPGGEAKEGQVPFGQGEIDWTPPQ